MRIYTLTLWWRMPISYRNHDIGLRHERVRGNKCSHCEYFECITSFSICIRLVDLRERNTKWRKSCHKFMFWKRKDNNWYTQLASLTFGHTSFKWKNTKSFPFSISIISSNISHFHSTLSLVKTREGIPKHILCYQSPHLTHSAINNFSSLSESSP